MSVFVCDCVEAMESCSGIPHFDWIFESPLETFEIVVKKGETKGCKPLKYMPLEMRQTLQVGFR